MFGFHSKLFSGHKTPGRKATYKPHFDDLEKRELMSVTLVGVVGVTTGTYKDAGAQPTAAGLALINSLPDPVVRSTALADYQDGSVSRNDMIDIFFKGSVGYTNFTNAAASSLQTLVNNGATVRMPDYVQFLASKSLQGNPTAQTLKLNVDNFFLGLKHPDAGSNGYIQVNKPLWITNPSPKDVYQTYYSKTNWLLTGLEEMVSRKRADITSMFTDNGDKTYTVRFYTRTFNGTEFVKVPMWVTVDNYLPNNGDEAFGDTSHSGVLWVALAVKAYAQANAYGGAVPTLDGSWGNSYKAVGLLSTAPFSYDSANPTWAFQFVTGLQARGVTGGGLEGLQGAKQAWLEGQYVSMVTRSDADPLFYPVGGTQPRWYALVNYVADASLGGRYTVTEDGKRYIEVPGSVLADHFLYSASSHGNPAPVPTSTAFTISAESATQLFQVAPPLQTIAVPTSVTLTSSTDPSGGAYTPQTVNAVDGVISNVSLTKAGTSNLQASSAGVPTIISGTIDVTDKNLVGSLLSAV